MAKRKDELRTRLTIEGDALRCQLGRHEAWRLPLNEITVVGEETDETGPWGDDWRLVFFTNSSQSWYDCSMYDNTILEVLAQLGGYLGSPLAPGLAGSTTFASRILYPETHVGEPVFTYRQQPPTWLMRIGLRPYRIEQCPTETVGQLIGR